MDVDLLRPGMIPIAPDTKLWFEFLIEPSLLEEHLNNPHAGIKIMNLFYLLYVTNVLIIDLRLKIISCLDSMHYWYFFITLLLL